MRKLLFVLLLLLCQPTISFAITLADFAKGSTYQDVKISPDGKHLAIQMNQNGKSVLIFLNRKTMKMIGGSTFPGRIEVGDFAWVNNERVVIEPVEKKLDQEQRVSYGELYSVNIDGSLGKTIYGIRAGEQQLGTRFKKNKTTFGWAEIVDPLPEDDNYILISSTPMSTKRNQLATIYKLHVYTGKLLRVKGTPIPNADYIINNSGDVVMASGLNKDNKQQVYYVNDDNDWEKVSHFDYGSKFLPLTLSEDGKSLLTLDNANNDKLGLYKLNIETGEYKKVFVDKQVDITNVQYTADNRSIYAVRVDPDYPNYIMLNSATDEAKVFKKFVKTFPGHKLTITSTDANGENFVLYVSAAYKPGSYYLYNKQKDRLAKLFDVIPGINEDQLVDVAPISFTASDGVTIHGYVTQTLTEKQSPQPLVVLVHGGPHGVRDYWSYDSEVQMLASQGYRVLQVNYRGSGGYGQKFLESGFLQWGARVQQDIIEGTQWVIDQGLVLKDRVCIMGGSFGGYSAVQSATLAPDLYKCVITNAGLSDLAMMYDKGDIPVLYTGEAYLEEAIGKDIQQLKTYSPVYNIEKLKAPVFIAHGGKDERVPPAHAHALKRALGNHNKEYVWYFKPLETHGFYSQANRAEYYQKLSSFLKQHL